jgi:hypothetical protein
MTIALMTMLMLAAITQPNWVAGETEHLSIDLPAANNGPTEIRWSASFEDTSIASGRERVDLVNGQGQLPLIVPSVRARIELVFAWTTDANDRNTARVTIWPDPMTGLHIDEGDVALLSGPYDPIPVILRRAGLPFSIRTSIQEIRSSESHLLIVTPSFRAMNVFEQAMLVDFARTGATVLLMSPANDSIMGKPARMPNNRSFVANLDNLIMPQELTHADWTDWISQSTDSTRMLRVGWTDALVYAKPAPSKQGEHLTAVASSRQIGRGRILWFGFSAYTWRHDARARFILANVIRQSLSHSQLGGTQ